MEPRLFRDPDPHLDQRLGRARGRHHLRLLNPGGRIRTEHPHTGPVVPHFGHAGKPAWGLVISGIMPEVKKRS